MKVLLVNDCPVHLPGYGGTESHIFILHRELKRRGHSCVVVANQKRGGRPEHTDDFYLVPDLNAQPLRKRFLRNVRESLGALRHLRNILDREQPQVAHVHNLLNPYVLRFLRKRLPVVKSIHDCRPFCVKPPPDVATRLVGDSLEFCAITLGPACWSRCYAHVRSSLKDTLEAWSYYPFNRAALRQVVQCHKIVVYSDYLKRLALTKASPGQVEYVPHFTDAENHHDYHLVQRPQPPIVLFVGRFEPAKGVLEMLRAIEKVECDSFRVILVGDGPYRDEVHRAIARLQGRRLIEHLSYLPHSELFALYRKASIVVFPSMGSEGCPLVGIEAMYQGTPVVGFVVGGVPEWLVDGSTGLAVDRGDVDGLARAITIMLKDQGLRADLSKGAVSSVRRRFRKDLHMARLVSVYEAARQQRSAEE